MSGRGIPRDIAKKLRGHKTDLMYSRYNIVNERGLNDATAKLAHHGTEPTPAKDPVRTVSY